MCKDTYVPHKFLLQIFITYLMYMFDTFIKVKGNLCWSVVKPIKLKIGNGMDKQMLTTLL